MAAPVHEAMGRLQWFKQAIEKIYIPQFVKGGDDSGDGGNGVLKINFDGTVETVANMSRIYSKRGFWQVVVRR